MLADIAASSFEIAQWPGARYESLIRLAEAIRANRDPQRFFQILVDELGKVVQFDAIAQYDECLNKVNWHLGQGCVARSAKPCQDLAQEETIEWWVQQHQESLIIRSVDEETQFPRMMQRLRECGIRSLCALPMSTVHRRLGSLLIASSYAHAYSDEEVRFLSLVVRQIAL